MDKLYRYTHKEIHGPSFMGRPRLSGDLVLETFTIIRETPCGYWIKYKDDKKWVNSLGTKAFARLSKKMALKDFINRKKKQVNFLKLNIRVIEDAVKLANKEYTT